MAVRHVYMHISKCSSYWRYRNILPIDTMIEDGEQKRKWFCILAKINKQNNE